LGRIAHIKDDFKGETVTTRIDGQPGILINIHKTRSEDAISISDEVYKTIADLTNALPPDMKINVLYDTSEATQDRIRILIKNGMMGLFLVLVILWLFIDYKLAFWVGIGIPFSLSGGLVILWLCDGTLNMVSLFSLVMVLGILADDAIVVGEAIVHYQQDGYAPLDAVKNGIRDVGKPVLVAVVTSIVAFLPLLFLNGMMGKFIAILPITIISCLLISLIESLVLLPAHLNHKKSLLSENGRKPRINLNRISSKVGYLLDRFVVTVFTSFLKKALNYRYATIASAITILLLSIGLILGGILKFEFFPETNGFIVTSTVRFPEGTPLDQSKNAVITLEKSLMRLNDKITTASGDPLVKNTISLVGQMLGDEAGEIEGVGPHLASVQAILLEPEKRGITTQEFLLQWKNEVGKIPGAEAVSFVTDSVESTEPDIQLNISGKDIKAMETVGERIKERLARFQGVYNIQDNYSQAKNEIQLKLKPEAQISGITVEDLASQIYSGYFGKEALSVQRDRELVKIKVRYSDKERNRVDSLETIRVRTPDGRALPLIAVADVDMKPAVSEIKRKDGLRQIVVSAYANKQITNVASIITELEDVYFPEWAAQFPGIEIKPGGEEEEEEMTMTSLYIGFPVAMLVIYLIIAATFQSYTQPLIILLIIPFGIAGAIFGHLVLGFNLYLMSTFGIVAISGVIINDAIVLIEQINKNLKKGLSYRDAIVKGSQRRFRAVFLTSISTIGGLAPLIMETNPHIQLLIPMAASIVGGMIFSTFITLALVPSILLVFHDIETIGMQLMGSKKIKPMGNKILSEF
jgi:multidrug efflux pump subunit AcrB